MVERAGITPTDVSSIFNAQMGTLPIFEAMNFTARRGPGSDTDTQNEQADDDSHLNC